MAKVKRKRYAAAEKQEIIGFVKDYNNTNGRGGQAAASKKFKVSQLSIATWLKGGGTSKRKASKKRASTKKGRAAESSGAKGSVASVLKRMTAIQEKIAALSADYEALKKQI